MNAFEKLLAEQKEARTCWFCEKHPEVRKDAYPIKLEKLISEERTYKRIKRTIGKSEISVPRCTECREVHKAIERIKIGAFLIQLLVGFGGCLGIAFLMIDVLGIGQVLGFSLPAVFFLLVFGLAFLYIQGAMKKANPENVKQALVAHQYPPVKEWSDQGYGVKSEGTDLRL